MCAPRDGNHCYSRERLPRARHGTQRAYVSLIPLYELCHRRALGVSEAGWLGGRNPAADTHLSPNTPALFVPLLIQPNIATSAAGDELERSLPLKGFLHAATEQKR